VKLFISDLFSLLLGRARKRSEPPATCSPGVSPSLQRCEGFHVKLGPSSAQFFPPVDARITSAGQHRSLNAGGAGPDAPGGCVVVSPGPVEPDDGRNRITDAPAVDDNRRR